MTAAGGMKKKSDRLAGEILRLAQAKKRESGRVFVVAGPSGVGKTSLCKALLKEMPDRLKWSVSHTTRRKRVGERHGREYYFVSEKDFRKLIARNAFVEHAVVHGNLYGTSKNELKRITRARRNALVEIDVQGALQVMRKFPAAVTIFVLPPSLAQLKKRLKGRGTDAPAVIRRRIENALGEIEKARKFGYLVVNDDFAEALSDLQAVVRAKGCRNPSRVAKKR